MSFSAGVKLADLDDFISPANECTKPLIETTKTKPKKSDLIKTKKDPETAASIASVALSDCLACSGCVTSAETVLLNEQSTGEFLKICQSNEYEIVMTISSASRNALSDVLSTDDVIHTVQSDLVKKNLYMNVIDMSFAEDISLSMTKEEASTSPDVVLTSHCPGWSLYAEKTQEDTVTNFMSKIRAPDQIAGIIVKTILPKLNIRLHTFPRHPRPIYHVTVSPCFDKKLEVLRDQYKIPRDFHGRQNIPGVDLVLTTTELIDLLKQSDITSQTNHMPETSSASSPLSRVISGLGLRLKSVPSGEFVSGGGYAEAVKPADREWASQRNRDLVNSTDLTGRTLLIAYGFRNIQNVVRRLKNENLSKGRIVEVMACPGGCKLGGGQPKPSPDISNIILRSSQDHQNSTLWDGTKSLINSVVQSMGLSTGPCLSQPRTPKFTNHEATNKFLLEEISRFYGEEPKEVFKASWRSFIGESKPSDLKW